MSFLEGVGSPLPAAPREISVRAGARSGLSVRPGGGRRRGGGRPGFPQSCGHGSHPPPVGPFLPSPPRGVALLASLTAVPGLWNSCVCKLPREGRGCALVRWARGPRERRGACRGLEGAARARQPLRVQVHRPTTPEPLEARAPLADPAARPWQRLETGGRKMSVIAEGEERGKCWCPLPRSCRPGGVTQYQDWGLAWPVLGGWVVRGGGRCPGEYSSPRALMGRTLLPPIAG